MQFAVYPLAWLSISYLIGIVFARTLPQTVELWFELLLAAVAFAFVSLGFRLFGERKKTQAEFSPVRPSFYLPLIFLAFFFGAYRFQHEQPQFVDPFFIGWFNDREYETLVTGIVSAPPDYRDTYTNLQLDVKTIIQEGKRHPLYVHGKLLVRVDSGETYRYGDPLRVRGIIQSPPENEEFSYREYLALHDIHAYMPQAEATFLPETRGGLAPLAAIYDLRERALANLYELFPDPEASLLAGILLGIDTGLPQDLQEAFKNTGTTHIIAISGFNITIIAGLFISLFGRFFGKRTGSLLAVLGIGAYTLLVGADAAVLRAALMGGIGLLGKSLGKRQDGIASLLFVSVIMAYINPMVLWDIGFQLSFAATAGLILYADPLTKHFVQLASRITSAERAKKIAAPIGEYFLFTLAAQFTTMPVMAYHFGRISLISFIANPFILPVQPAVMILGGIALIASLLFLPLGKFLAIFALPFTTYTIRTVEFFARMPRGVIVLGNTKLLLILLIYAAMLAWTFAGFRLKKISKSLSATVLLAALAILTIQVWRVALARPDGRLHITFFNVNSADAILIQTPDGENILINGGEHVSTLSAALGERLPPFHRGLDWLIVASPQEAQVAALPRSLERFPPRQVLWSGNREASRAARRLEKYLVQAEIPLTDAKKGQVLDLGEDISLRIQAASARGSVLLLEWESFRALLPIGMDFDDLDDVQTLGEVSVLLLADSGYAPINPPELIEALHPQLIVLSVAADDWSGLPNRSLLQEIEGYSLLRTDKNGWVHISTNGKEMWVECEY